MKILENLENSCINEYITTDTIQEHIPIIEKLRFLSVGKILADVILKIHSKKFLKTDNKDQ